MSVHTSQIVLADSFERTGSTQTGIQNLLNTVFTAARRNAGVHDSEGAVALDAIRAQIDKRMDADFRQFHVDATGGPSTGGLVGAGALRALMTPVMSEMQAELNAFKLFYSDTSTVRLGQNEVQADRVFVRGGVATWTGAHDNVPTLDAAQASRTWKVGYYITQIMSDVFRDLIENVANTGRWALIMRMMVRVMEEWANHKTWFGDDVSGTLGVLNYPWFTRITINNVGGKAWSTDEDFSSVATSGYVDELVRFTNHNWLASKGAVKPTRMIVGMKLFSFLKSTNYKASTSPSGDNPKTLLDLFLSRSAIINRIEQIAVAQELDDAFATGVSCVVLDSPDQMVIRNILPGGGPQLLPLVKEGFNYYQPMFMAHGGIISLLPQSVTIGLVDTSAA